MKFEDNICIDSFKYVTDSPIDCRFVVESLKDMAGDIVYYDGCITYVKDIDTYVIHNNGTIQPLIMRHKVANLIPMLSELKYKDDPFSEESTPFVTEETISIAYLFNNYTTIEDGSGFANRSRIPYFDISRDYESDDNINISSNANTVFNKYMRGYDCIMDFEHNIFVSKTCEKVNFEDNVHIKQDAIFFSFGRLFNPNTSVDTKVEIAKELSDDNFRLIKLLSDNMSALAEIVERISTKVFTDPADHETLTMVQSLKNSIMNGLESEINTVKDKMRRKNDEIRTRRTSYNDQSMFKPVPAPKEYEHLEKTNSRKIFVAETL